MCSKYGTGAFITDVILIRVNLSFPNFVEQQASAKPLHATSLNELIEASLKNIASVALDCLPALSGHLSKFNIENCVFRQEAAMFYGLVYLSLSQPSVIEDAFLRDAKDILCASREKSLILSVDARGDRLDLTHIELSRLTQISSFPGYSASEKSRIHYVVQTDVQSGWDLEIDHWYAKEHLPGLASVPGCVVAKRYVNQDEGPKSLAFYDLLSQETLISKEWLAVRATPWASRARPHFINTQRDIYPHVMTLS